MGARTIRTPDNRQRLLAVVQTGGTNRDAAQTCGISESSLYKWLAEDTDFGEVYAQARAAGRVKSIKLIAESDDWRAHAWLLERVDPANWSNQAKLQVEVSKKMEEAEAAVSTIEAYLAGRAETSDA